LASSSPRRIRGARAGALMWRRTRTPRCSHRITGGPRPGGARNRGSPRAWMWESPGRPPTGMRRRFADRLTRRRRWPPALAAAARGSSFREPCARRAARACRASSSSRTRRIETDHAPPGRVAADRRARCSIRGATPGTPRARAVAGPLARFAEAEERTHRRGGGDGRGLGLGLRASIVALEPRPQLAR